MNNQMLTARLEQATVIHREHAGPTRGCVQGNLAGSTADQLAVGTAS